MKRLDWGALSYSHRGQRGSTPVSPSPYPQTPFLEREKQPPKKTKKKKKEGKQAGRERKRGRGTGRESCIPHGLAASGSSNPPPPPPPSAGTRPSQTSFPPPRPPRLRQGTSLSHLCLHLRSPPIHLLIFHFP